MGITRLGLPYPEPSALANKGAADIKALAESVDALTVAKAGMPFLHVGGVGAVALNAVYPWTTVTTDTHAAWDATTKRYKIPIAGLYEIAVHTKCNASGGYDEPAIQTAATVAGTYSNRFTRGNPTNAPYNSMYMRGLAVLPKDSGVRIMEGGGAWTGYNDPPTGSNFLQILYLGPV